MRCSHWAHGACRAGSDDGSDDGTFDEAESAEMCGPAEKKPPTAHTCGACSKQRPDGLIEVKGRPGHFWKLGAWTECPEGCGSMQTRDVTCVKCASDPATPACLAAAERRASAALTLNRQSDGS